MQNDLNRSRRCADLFAQLRITYVSSKKEGTDVTAPVRLALKSSSFAYCRTVEKLVRIGWFTSKPINLYFVYLSVFLPVLFSQTNYPQQVHGNHKLTNDAARLTRRWPPQVSTQLEEQIWRPIRDALTTMTDRKKGRRSLYVIAKHLMSLTKYVDVFGTKHDNYIREGASTISKAAKAYRERGETVPWEVDNVIPATILKHIPSEQQSMFKDQVT